LVYLLESKSKYDLTSTIYSGQSFVWNPVISGEYGEDSIHEGIIGNERYRIRSALHGLEIILPLKLSKKTQAILGNYFRLDDDLDDIFQSVPRNDGYLSKLIIRYKGLHLLRQDPWECLVSFICSSNNNMKRIRRMIDNIRQFCGPKHSDINGIFSSFPSAKILMDFGEQNLREIGLGFRAKYVYETAVIMVEENVDLNEVRNFSYQDALSFLTRFPGVGDKVANCVMLFSLDQLRAFPVDVWIKRVLRQEYFFCDGINISDNMLRPNSQKLFGPNAGYVNQYLFHSR
jgi:N-glycosylase/DNA lyase